MLYGNELVITDAYPTVPTHADASGTRDFGLVPRDWVKYPLGYYPGEVGMHAVPDLVSFSPSDFPAMIKELEDTQTRLSDFRNKGMNGQPIPSRDQNGKGYCWAHSGVSAHLLIRARDDMPYSDLSAYSIACQIKNFADEGGWGAQGLDWQMKNGCATATTWPQQSMSHSNVNATMKTDEGKHKITEGWIDMGAAQYDRNLTFNQVITSLLCRVPVIVDYNWWSHSVCATDAVNGASQAGKTRTVTGKLMRGKAFDAFWSMNNPTTAGISIRIWNSWGDSWSENGMGVLVGSKAIPDGATAPRVVAWTAA